VSEPGIPASSEQPMELLREPKLTPSLLRFADTMCARRLVRSVDGGERSTDPVNRSRVRDAFLAAARDAHAELHEPRPAHFAGIGSGLEPEERRVLEQAAHWYVAMFGSRAAQYVDHGLDEPSRSKRLGLRLGGWVDLALVGDGGAKEYRHFELWNGRAPVCDPLELESVKAAVLRLASWAGDEALRVVWADLVRGLSVERTVDVAHVLPELRDWLDGRVRVIRERIAAPTARSGSDCGPCVFVARCPEHPTGAHASATRTDMLPGIVTVTPTALDEWHRCRRAWRNHTVLQVPASDGDAGTAHGQQMHDLLRLVHQQGSCRDGALVEDVLRAHNFHDDARVAEAMHRHAARCPVGAVALGHEVTHARFHRLPLPVFMATARIDALWLYDGILDAHDYKTGRVWNDRVCDDRQARLQAWVLAPLAERHGARLRITFEHLAAEIVESSEPFEPDADDLAEIEEELRATVASMRAEESYRGVGDVEVCGWCRYRSICPDSASPSEPAWPRVDDESDLAAEPSEDGVLTA
jgi:PD-(D/E)XK nuclease superfamily